MACNTNTSSGTKCSKCNSGNNKCGCTDSPYTTVKTYTCPPDEQCPTPTPCSEYVDTACVIYNNAGIVELGISDGTSLQEILQKLAIILDDLGLPACADPTSACQATFNVYPTDVSSTSITLSWSPNPTAVTYVVEYKTAAAVIWNVLPAQPAANPTQILINNLTANTEYYVRVLSTCALGNCYSATISITTLPSA